MSAESEAESSSGKSVQEVLDALTPQQRAKIDATVSALFRYNSGESGLVRILRKLKTVELARRLGSEK